MHSAVSQSTYDYIVVGAGPAGLQLGHDFGKGGANYLILEANDSPGSFFTQFPRHRKLISINKVHCGTMDSSLQFRWDWNSLLTDDQFLFRQYSQDYFPHPAALRNYLSDFALRYGLRIEYRRRVERIQRSERGFSLKSGDHEFHCRQLIIATGLPEPFVPKIPGIELAENYASADLTAGRFANRKVLIIGKGNSGFETADALIPFAAQIHVVSPSSLRMAWNTHHVGHLRAVNNNLIDTDLLKAQNATIWGNILSIEHHRAKFVVRIAHADSHFRVFTHVYDSIICCTGFKMSVAPFDPSAMPTLMLDDRFPKLTERWESVNVAGLYFAGCLTQGRDFKRSSSAFIHGFRYNSRALFNMLNEERGMPWPRRALPKVAAVLTNQLMKRINRASSLWHQFNFMSDVVSFGGETILYFEDVPTDYALTKNTKSGQPSLLLTFTHDKPVDSGLHANFSKEPALHPRLELVLHGERISEHHMFEDLEAEWYEESLYIAPLEKYVAEVLSATEQFVVTAHHATSRSRMSA